MYIKMTILMLFLATGCLGEPVSHEEIGQKQYILTVNSIFPVKNSNKLLKSKANYLCYGDFKVISIAKVDKFGNNQIMVVKCTGEEPNVEAKKQL